jgi:hypothetical protein
MQKTHRVLNIFPASPTDVNAERTVADEVVVTINKGLGRLLGWQLDCHKWEETAPAFGRPQDIIKPSVDDCELFIGLLGERWGQPTGQHSSGFEEEFERARNRRKTQGEPEIWLFFKHVNPARARDAGPQLSQVLKFREKQEALREVLFREVVDIDDWKAQLQDWLVQHVIKQHLALQAAQREAAASVPILGSSLGSEIEASASDTGKGAPQRLKILFEHLDKAIHDGKLEFSRQDTKFLQEV